MVCDKVACERWCVKRWSVTVCERWCVCQRCGVKDGVLKDGACQGCGVKDGV